MTSLFPDAVNFRDIGRSSTPELPIRSGVIFRSGLLHHLANNRIGELVAATGVRTVVDLRTPREHAAGLVNWNTFGVRLHHVPLIDYDEASTREQFVAFLAILSGRFDWSKAYQTIVAGSPSSFVEILSALAEPDALPAVIHCTAGRDRTGIVVGLLLDLLGAPIVSIANDYARTGEQLRPHLPLIAAASRADWLHPRLMGRIVRTTPETMVSFLQKIRADHGSTEQFLRKHGLHDKTITRLRSAVLAPSGGDYRVPGTEIGVQRD